MRVNPNVTILFSKNIDTPERYTIAPLILIPFIENAFKHGISTQQNCTIQIQLDVYNGQLVMQVTNQIYRSQSIDNSNAGIGIANTQRRLGLVYPGSHDLKITEENNTYTVNLKIKLV
jgi:sensor histidine kinase YesM